MRRLVLVAALFAAGPAAAAEGPFFSLGNTDFVVLLAFLLFIGILVYFKVPQRVNGMLDKRADGIRAELDEARALREEAQTVLASYERKHQEIEEQARRIVESAREEAKLAAEQAKKDLDVSIERRLASAQGQIASAEAAAVKEVRDRAIQVAVAAAAEVIAAKMDADRANKLIDESIATVDSKLH